MAVDIKQLRVGSHISINGVRVEVESLQGGDMVGCITPDNDWFATESWRFEPIPITSDLLTELGFKWRKDAACWRKYQNYDGERYDWGIYAYGSDGGTWCFSLYLPNFLIKPQVYAGHLHELEGQLAYYGVELIKE